MQKLLNTFVNFYIGNFVNFYVDINNYTYFSIFIVQILEDIIVYAWNAFWHLYFQTF